MDDDPWDWEVDRVVQELCTENRTWQPYSQKMPRPDPSLLEKALREQMITGSILLMVVGDKEMKEDLGIKVLGQRGFIRSAIADLRVKSVTYKVYMGEHHVQSVSASHRTGSVNDFAPEHVPAIRHSNPDQYPLSPSLSLGNRDTPITRQSPSGQYALDASGNKRRKLGFDDFSENDGGQSVNGVNQEDATNHMVNDLEDHNGNVDTVAQPDAGTPLDSSSKKTKRIAPTLITSEIDPNRNRDMPTHADNDAGIPLDINGKKTKRIAPTLITSEIDPNRNRDMPTNANKVIYNDSQSIEPGVRFLGDEGNTKLVTALQSDPSSTEPHAYATPLSNRSNRKPRREPRFAEDNIGTGYLGKQKICVDDIFFEGVEVGQEILASGGSNEFSSGHTDISSGRRLYVSRMMRHFLRSEPRAFVRSGELFSAIVPYAPKFTPRFHKASFTLYSSSSDGRVHSRREEIRSWPEIDPEATAKKSYSGIEEHSATFNPLGPDMLNGLGSYDQWDPDSLQKYQHLEGGDEILPLYGESDEENEYDEETWQEIETERGAKLEKPERPMKNPPISANEVNAAIDRGIAGLVTKWNERKLPKLQFKGFKLWHKSHKLKTWKDDILSAREKLVHMAQRITKIREEILSDKWSSEMQVLKQVSILEPSVFDREALVWTIAVLEKKAAPEKLLKVPSVKTKKSTVRSDDGEDEGESLDSDSSSDDDMEGFIVDDDPMDLEEHELNLADGEASDDDATMSDRSGSARYSAKPDHPIEATKVVRKSTDAKGTAVISQLNERQTPSATASVKTEDPTLPKHRAVAANAPNTIDLTGLTSDSDPVTPKKTKLRLINRNSPFSSPISLEAEERPDPNNLPDLQDFRSIGRYQSQAWEQLMDRERLLISILHRMDIPTRKRIFDFISTISEPELWYNMAQVMSQCRIPRYSVKGMDSHTFETLTFFIRLFEVYVDCKSYPYRELPTPSSIQKVEDAQNTFFTKFYRCFKKLPGYFDRKLSSHISSSLFTQKRKAVTIDESDEDGEPVPAMRRQRPEGLTSSEDDVFEDTPRKKQRKIFEDKDARNLREQDRQRLAEQEERRRNLQKTLALNNQTGAVNKGQIIINDAKADDQGYVYVHPHISGRIKKHQIEGVRFMWNQIVGDENVMQGCLLAHQMGLGKTMQVITLLVAIAEAAASKDQTISSQVPKILHKPRSLILCPPTLINNWMDELMIWAPYDPEGTNILGGFWQVSSSVSRPQRLQNISQWYERGGVLVIGYEMFRAFILNKENKSGVAALSEEVHAKVQKELLEGPSIIIADEAHKMKNAKASTTETASRFKSSSRVALTGSPLANNVEEYHTMIDWVAPNYLGPAKEFRGKYVEPIQAGLWSDSSSSERRKSLKMLGVLKEDIAPKVHRADVSVLRNDLPPKKEFVITVPLTELQKKAYSLYVKSMMSGTGHARTKDGEIKQSTLWHWLAVLSLLCNHPYCFNEKLNERKGDAKKEAARVEEAPTSLEPTDRGEEIAQKVNESIWKVGVSQELIQAETALFEAEGVDMQSIELSNKVKILCQILDASRAAKDKVLVFSQSIPTLDFLEKLCIKQGRKYAMLTGKTKMSSRQSSTKDFNTGNDELYLISTTAGGLGLNLPSANRVVIFDFKFNPIMEEQAVGRAFRIGQLKETFVYRFVTGGTFENTVHNKTIFKMQLASRVIDKKNPIAHAKKNISDFLFEPRIVEQQDLTDLKGMDSKVLDHILEPQHNACTIKAIVQTDTFELDDDDKLTAEEEKEVKQLLVDEKLKRSNPQAWHELQLKKSGRAVQQMQASQAAPNMTTHPGPFNRIISSQFQYSAGPVPGSRLTPPGKSLGPYNRAVSSQPQSSAGALRQPQPNPPETSSSLTPSQGSTGTTRVPSPSVLKEVVNAAAPAMKPPPRPTPALGNSAAIVPPAIKPLNPTTTPTQTPSTPMATSTNSAKAESPAIRPPQKQKSTLAAVNPAGAATQQTSPVPGTSNPGALSRTSKEIKNVSPPPDRGRPIDVNTTRASSVASRQVAQSTPGSSSSTPRLVRSEGNDLASIRSVLVEAAKKSHEWSNTAEQTLATASKLSDQIGAAIERHPGHKLSLNAVRVALQGDSIKCQALLSAQMSPDSLVQQMVPSDGSPDGNMEVDNVTKVGASQNISSSAILPSKRTQRSNGPTVSGNKESQRPASPKSQAGSQSTAPRYEFQLFSQLQEYLRSHGLSEEGTREELILRCQAKQKDLSAQTMKDQEGNIEPSTKRQPSQSATFVATAKGDSSMSSDRRLS